MMSIIGGTQQTESDCIIYPLLSYPVQGIWRTIESVQIRCRLVY